jgi:hypothetical protein
MMAGVEAAGFVLAALPLVIGGLKSYGEGVQTIRRWLRYAAHIEKLTNRLDDENTKFLNNCELILQDLVPAADLEILLASPGGPRWKDAELQQQLQEILGRSFMPYMRAVEDIERATESFKAKLEIDVNGQVKF